MRKNFDQRAADFENLQLNLRRLNLRGFVSFTKDMEIPIDMPRLNETWKKSLVQGQTQSYDDFKNSLPKLALASHKYKLE